MTLLKGNERQREVEPKSNDVYCVTLSKVTSSSPLLWLVIRLRHGKPICKALSLASYGKTSKQKPQTFNIEQSGQSMGNI